MCTRSKLEAALENAEAEWCNAYRVLDQAQVARTTANAAWTLVLNDRRKSVTDRRKARGIGDYPFPERRKADSDRRIPDADIAALAKAVADRHEAYLCQSKAEADWSIAQARLNAATAERHQLKAQLNALNRAQRIA